LCMLGAA